MAQSSEGFRSRLRQRLNHFRDKSQSPSNDARIHSSLHTKSEPTSIPHRAKLTAGSLPVDQATEIPMETTNAGTDKAQTTLCRRGHERNLTTGHLDLGDNVGSVIVPSDLWSAAYREAVDNMKEEIDVAILTGKSIEQLFRELEDFGSQAANESAFVRGVHCLRSLQVPLERLKLALDVASPLTSIEPTTNAVFGVVRGVTAIAISLATADLDFAKQIGDMLEQISYLDDCDTLGQKTDRKDIHKALVMVYQKLLEFYQTAFEVLTRRGPKLIMKMVLETGHLPTIVQEFLTYANNLQVTIQKATADILADISSMLYDREVASWLGGAKLSRQSEYDASLRDLRADKACEFILHNPEFINWYRASDYQQLVILGEMGCGKTVAMAFLVDELRRRKEHELPEPKICYYYCRDDETGKAIYIYSALILSLLQQLPGLLKPFVEWYKEARVSGISDPAKDIRKLEEFLQKLLESTDRQVFVILDGLDECNPEDRDSLLDFLKSLSQRDMRLKTILSSRPREEILEQLGDTARIRLSSDPQRDGIIVEKIVETQLRRLPKDIKDLVIEKLTPLVQGSAIWTKMIITLLRIKNIRAIGPLRRFFENMPLPDQLSELYKTLLLRCTLDDLENQELASIALKLLAISRRPLSILELAWAVALGVSQDVTTIDALAERVDHQRVMSLIHPFIAGVDFSDLKKRQVRLVHQSVKEFILKGSTSNQPCLAGLALSKVDGVIPDQCLESPEAFIFIICLRYLLLDDVGNRDLFSEEQVAIAELPQEFELFTDDEESVEYDPYCTWEAWEKNMVRYDPSDRGFGEFFVYASCHWLEHFGATTFNPLPSLVASIETLCRAGSTRLCNWVQQYCRPDCAITARIEFESSLYDPLSITSLYGSKAILCDMLENSDFDKDNFLQDTAVEAADQVLRWSDVSRLRILFFHDRLRCQLQTLDFFRLIIRQWHNPNLNHQDWDSVFDLINEVSYKMVQERWGNELLCVAAGADCLPIVQRLVTKAQHDAELRSELLHVSRLQQSHVRIGKPAHQSIGEAVMGNHINMVEYLLEETAFEVHLRYRNALGENVLHLASKLCNPEMFRLLIPRFQEGIYQTDNNGDTALVRVIMNFSASGNRYESARIILLQSDADWNRHSWEGQQNPLRAAVQVGDIDMCRALISIGNMNPLDALTCDIKGQVILKDKLRKNKENMQRILQLLCTHADVESMSAHC
ncbi:hypothetical protein BDW59DRAFT_155281 [Aspergillus cavernicola]|uniref:NACHT domain-containing protein n=1 Tax=Aspergillus cavernicola TaxID=176166 RepID=A0ABR4HAG1_9EURO